MYDTWRVKIINGWYVEVKINNGVLLIIYRIKHQVKYKKWYRDSIGPILLKIKLWSEKSIHFILVMRLQCALWTKNESPSTTRKSREKKGCNERRREKRKSGCALFHFIHCKFNYVLINKDPRKSRGPKYSDGPVVWAIILVPHLGYDRSMPNPTIKKKRFSAITRCNFPRISSVYQITIGLTVNYFLKALNLF